MDSKSLGVDNTDISIQTDAKNVVDAIKAGINRVSSAGGNPGTIQNRLWYTINYLSLTAENMTDAEIWHGC